MIYTNLYPDGATLSRAELQRQEARRTAEFADLLTGLYATPGVVYGLSVLLQGSVVSVDRGIAVVTDPDGNLSAVGVDRLQSLNVTQDGSWGVYLNPDSRVQLDPQLLANPARTVYMRRAQLAFAPGGLSVNEGVIDTPGLLLSAVGGLNSRHLLLGVVTRTGGVCTLEMFYPTAASVRGAVESSGNAGGGLTIVTENDLDSALKGKVNGAMRRDGSTPMLGNLDMLGSSILKIGSMTPLTDNGVISANVTKHEGKSVAEIVALAQAGMTGGGTPTVVQPDVVIKPFRVNTVIPMGDALPAPRTLTATLPAGSLPTGKSYADGFTGEGGLLNRAGLVLTFSAALRFGLDVTGSWINPGTALTVGAVLGFSGPQGTFFASSVAVISPTEVRHLLQRVLPGAVPSVTIFDSATVAKAAGDPVPAPYALDYTVGTLMWGGRSTGVTVNPNGDPSDPAVTAPSVWIRGYRMNLLNSAGFSVQRGTLAVVGTYQLLVSTDTVPSLSAGA